MRFYEAWMSKIFFERAQDWIEPFYVAHLKDAAGACRQFRKFGGMCGVVGDRFLDEHMFALGEKSSGDLVMSIGRRRYRSGVNHLDEVIERFGRHRARLARNGATPERLHVIYRGELSGGNFRI